MADYFRVSATDRVLLELMPARESGVFVIVAEFDAALDERALRTAWDETVARHPILGARRPEAEAESWDCSPADGNETLPIVTLSVSNEGAGTRVRIELDHAALDGRAGFLVLETLRDRYRFRARTRMADWTPRTFADAMTAAEFPHFRAQHAIAKARERWAGLAPSEHRRPAGEARIDGPEVVRVGLDREQSARLVRLARETRTAMTALSAGVLAVAWERAAGSNGPMPVSGWLISNDLRPTLGIAGGIGNLSGVEALWFEAPVSNVAEVIAGASASYEGAREAGFGLASQVLSEQWLPVMRMPGGDVAGRGGIRMLRGAQRYTRVLANMGAVPAGLLDWGDARIRDLEVWPAFRGLDYDVFSVSTFDGALSVLWRLAGSSLAEDFVTRLRTAIGETFAEAASLDPGSPLWRPRAAVSR